jgi:hypothetical protein
MRGFLLAIRPLLTDRTAVAWGVPQVGIAHMGATTSVQRAMPSAGQPIFPCGSLQRVGMRATTQNADLPDTDAVMLYCGANCPSP